jgi:hypothetical protein
LHHPPHSQRARWRRLGRQNHPLLITATTDINDSIDDQKSPSRAADRPFSANTPPTITSAQPIISIHIKDAAATWGSEEKKVRLMNCAIFQQFGLFISHTSPTTAAAANNTAAKHSAAPPLPFDWIDTAGNDL